MQRDGEAIESVDETLSSGQSRLEASRRMLDHLDRRLSRGSRLLEGDSAREEQRTSEG
jgi:hypothetical protein